MKYLNLIKLLSVLLCIVMLFAACSEAEEETTETVTTETETETVTETETEETDEPYVDVDPVIDNFIDLEYKNDWNELGAPERIDNVILNYFYYDIVITSDATVDHMGVVTETFNVYNLKLSKVVLTVSHTYDDLAYTSTTDWRSNVQSHETLLPESMMKVSIFDGCCIVVEHATLVRLDEDFLEENPDAYAYEVECVYDYYDLAGTKLGQTKGLNPRINRSGLFQQNGIYLTIGNTNVVLDSEDKTLVGSITAETEEMFGNFDYENEKYGYFEGNNGLMEYFEVYKKATGEHNRYYLEHDNSATGVFAILKNGDIVAQYVHQVSNEAGVSYDYIANSQKMAVDTYLVDVSKQEVREIEVDYVIAMLATQEDFVEWTDIEKTGISFTDKAWNVAIAKPIVDKQIDDSRIVIFNNDMEAVYEMDPIVPGHTVAVAHDDEIVGIKVLLNGDLLVDLVTYTLQDDYGESVQQAIITREGKVRCYLDPDCQIVGNYIVNDEHIYDFDMNELYSFEENEQTLEGTIGNNIIVSESVEDWKWDEFDEMYYDVKKTEYYTLTKVEEGFEKTLVFEDQEIDEFGYDGDYVITYSTESYNGERKYTLYNANLEHVLTTQGEMHINAVEDGYLVYMYVDGYVVYYTVKY